MVWDQIIERNVERLVAVLTELFVMAGFGRGGAAFLPRSADPAAPRRIRRLIIMAACGIIVKLRNGGVCRAMPGGWPAGGRGGA